MFYGHFMGGKHMATHFFLSHQKANCIAKISFITVRKTTLRFQLRWSRRGGQIRKTLVLDKSSQIRFSLYVNMGLTYMINILPKPKPLFFIMIIKYFGKLCSAHEIVSKMCLNWNIATTFLDPPENNILALAACHYGTVSTLTGKNVLRLCEMTCTWTC